jgi:hypothetical protein
MTKVLQFQNDKEKGLTEIREILHSFCKNYLNDELESYAIKLCENLGRKRKIDILRGKKEIWAASIIYAIARLNFLFDKENEKYITADTICNFFNTNKSTVGNKATQIENACNLTIGAKEYCSKEITDSFSFYHTPEGFFIPKNMAEDRELVVGLATEEESAEIEKFVQGQRKLKEQKDKEKKERRAESNRKIAEQKNKNIVVKNQVNLFENF